MIDWPKVVQDLEAENARLKKALAEPEQVAFKVYHGELCYKSTDDDQSYGMWCPVDENYRPPFPDGTKFHPAPPQKQWVGLTEDEKHQLNTALNLQGRFPIIEAIEAKLKEKNT